MIRTALLTIVFSFKSQAQTPVLSLDTILNRIDQNNLQLKSYGLKAERFYEPDYDIFWSAMSTAPISREEGKIFKKLPLWKP